MKASWQEYVEALKFFLGEKFLEEHRDKVEVLYVGGFDVECCALTLFELYLKEPQV